MSPHTASTRMGETEMTITYNAHHTASQAAAIMHAFMVAQHDDTKHGMSALRAAMTSKITNWER